MKLKLVVCFCLVEIVGIFGKSARIIGGENADIKEFPYVVSLAMLNVEKHFCGGTIISNWHILTAAHCVAERDYASIRIYMGNSNLQDSKDNSYGIMTVVIHPQFKNDIRNDIAVIMLDRCIIFNEFQNKINLPTKDVKAGSVGVITGWGRTNVNILKPADVLQKASTKILSNSECHKSLKMSIMELMCVFERKGIGACYGDSGSPLVSNGEFVGIGARVFDCAVGIPDIYTRVYPYVDFIKSIFTISKLLTCTADTGII
ncbi:PREDICTED: chymotrypsin-2-like [Ceratosolen solmsi marchali]|uniref:Chymotrypsin-2-like n=1 Tax=Ceratosolen solmsi marchali TaxID=326594 RepID=A0AAJ7E1Y2_9HYME|nr:PREDICTED: chymotrypsin-2-like [Ceratosolen solmsi marchali]